MPDISLERMINLMDKLNIGKICCSHLAGLLAHHFEYAHRETLKAIKRFPGRIFGYAIYDPNYPTESLKSIKEYLRINGFIGIKIHPAMHVMRALKKSNKFAKNDKIFPGSFSNFYPLNLTKTRIWCIFEVVPS